MISFLQQYNYQQLKVKKKVQYRDFVNENEPKKFNSK